jgi:hypothetical protein
LGVVYIWAWPTCPEERGTHNNKPPNFLVRNESIHDFMLLLLVIHIG